MVPHISVIDLGSLVPEISCHYFFAFTCESEAVRDQGYSYSGSPRSSRSQVISQTCLPCVHPFFPVKVEFVS